MSYKVSYINCRVCGFDSAKLLGIRGNQEYACAPALINGQEHIVTNVVRCAKCGFVYTNPLIQDDIRSTYGSPEKYRPAADSADPKALFGPVVDLIEKHAKTGKVLLDLGCGKGEFMDTARSRGWQVYGIEASEKMADYAAQKYGFNTVKKGSLKDAGFPDLFFDAVTMNMVLEHLDNPKETAMEVNRILKKGGILFIEAPNTDSLMLKAATVYFRLKARPWSPLLSPLHHPFHCYGYNARSLKYLMELCGFYVKISFTPDSCLRGVESGILNTNMKKRLFAATSKIFSIAGRGDILIAIAVKK